MDCYFCTMQIEQLDLFGNIISTQQPKKIAESNIDPSSIEVKNSVVEFLDNEPIVYIDDNLIVKVKTLKEPIETIERTDRKSVV